MSSPDLPEGQDPQPQPSTEIQLPRSLAESQELSVPQEAVQHADAPNIAGYLLVSPLGRGAYAQVWKGWQMRTRKWVAVKVFIERAGVHWLFLQREVERLVRLDKHPNIVSLLDADLTGETPYYVMDYLEKGSLERFVGSLERPSPETAARWMREIAEALSYVHSKGLIHCDLKPANVLLDDEGRVRVADFGQSRILSDSAGALGTLFYMAPEQAVVLKDGEQLQPDVRWDVYALGTTMYALLTGKVPYQEQDCSALEKAQSLEKRLGAYRELVQSRPLQSPRALVGKKLDEDLDAIVTKCAGAVPEGRYPTLTEVLADLKARREKRPVSPLAGRRLYRLKRFLQRNALPVSISIAAALALGWSARQILHKKAELAQQLAVSDRMRKEVTKQLSESLVLRARNFKEKGDDGAAALLYAEANKVWPSTLARANAMAYLELLPKPMRFFHSNLYQPLTVFSPDGRLAAFQTDADGSSWVLDVASGSAVSVLDKASQPIAFSPDGKLIAAQSSRWDASSSSSRFFLRLWDIARGNFLEIPIEADAGPRTQLVSLQFSANGKRLLIATLNTIRLWDVAAGKPIGTPIKFHDLPLDPEDILSMYGFGSVALSPDGRKVLTGASWEGAGRIWDVASGKPIGLPLKHEQEKASSPELANAQKMMQKMMQNLMKSMLSVANQPWNSASPGALAKKYAPRRDGQLKPTFGAVAFSPDSRWAFTADKYGQLWDTATGKPLGPAMRHEGDVRLAVFSPDGKRIATGCIDNTAHIWSLPEGKHLDKIMAHEKFKNRGEGIRALSFSQDGKRLLTGSVDGTARLWNSYTGEPLSFAMRHEKELTAAAFGAEGNTILTGSQDGHLRVWGPGRMDLPNETFTSTSTSFGAMALSPDGKRLIAASERAVLWQSMKFQTVQIWNLDSRRPIGKDMEHPKGVRRISLSPDGKRVLTLADDNALRLWDAMSGEPLGEPMRHGEMVNAESFSPDGRMIASASSVKKQATAFSIHGTLTLWDGLTGKALLGGSLEFKDVVAALAFSPDGKRLAAGTWDGSTFLIDTQTGRQLGRPMRHERMPNTGSNVNVVLFSPDGRRILTASNDRSARLWDSLSYEPLGRPMRHEDAVIAAAFSPDGRTIVTGGADRTARIWDAATGMPKGKVLPHEGPVGVIEFHPGGRCVLTGAQNEGAVRLWDVESGEPLGQALTHRGISSPAFLPDGGRILTADQGLRLWSLDWLVKESPADAIALSTRRATLRRIDGQGNIAPLEWPELEAMTGPSPGDAASVNGTAISAQDFEKAYNARRRNDNIPADLAALKALRLQVLQSMVNRELARQQAKDLHLEVTAEELDQAISTDKVQWIKPAPGQELSPEEVEDEFVRRIEGGLGLTMKEYRQSFMLGLLTNKVLEKQVHEKFREDHASWMDQLRKYAQSADSNDVSGMDANLVKAILESRRQMRQSLPPGSKSPGADPKSLLGISNAEVASAVLDQMLRQADTEYQQSQLKTANVKWSLPSYFGPPVIEFPDHAPH